MHSKSLLGNYRPCCLCITVALGFPPSIIVGHDRAKGTRIAYVSVYLLDRSNVGIKKKPHHSQLCTEYTVETEVIHRIPISALFKRAKHSTGDSQT